MTKVLTLAQHQQQVDRLRLLREVSELGLRFKRTGPRLHSTADLGKQTFMPLTEDKKARAADIRKLKATLRAATPVLPREVFARAFFDGVDAVNDPQKREIMVLKAQMEEILDNAIKRQLQQQQPKPG